MTVHSGGFPENSRWIEVAELGKKIRFHNIYESFLLAIKISIRIPAKMPYGTRYDYQSFRDQQNTQTKIESTHGHHHRSGYRG